MPAGTIVDENYRLGGGDRLRIRFFDRYDRDDLNGEYVVAESGQIRLPRIGVFDARDKTPSELEREIRRNVESKGEKLGYFSIDIAQCRPFYVTGLANKPGSYPYLPGYTVLHAVSVAGGLYRAPLSSVADSMREKRILNETMDRLVERMARRARLEAERTSADAIGMPKELTELEPVRGAELIASETDLMQRAREVTKREKTALESTIQLANSEIESYRTEIARTGKRIEEMSAVFDQLKTLHDQRVINQQRLFEATAALDSAQRDKQTAFAGHTRARADLGRENCPWNFPLRPQCQEIAETDREIARLKAAGIETRLLASARHAFGPGRAGPGYHLPDHAAQSPASWPSSYCETTRSCRGT
jgi:protein involved in polysaccharide export with SLBB domain